MNFSDLSKLFCGFLWILERAAHGKCPEVKRDGDARWQEEVKNVSFPKQSADSRRGTSHNEALMLGFNRGCTRG